VAKTREGGEGVKSIRKKCNPEYYMTIDKECCFSFERALFGGGSIKIHENSLFYVEKHSHPIIYCPWCGVKIKNNEAAL
jgi:hypothetical protein